MIHEQPGAVEPLPSVLTIAPLVYALHVLAIDVGIIGAATIVGNFVGSTPSLLAVILNYMKRGEARDPWVASYYRWQIRRFWFALLWALIGWVLVCTLIGAVVVIPILIVLTFWPTYRVGRGWLRLSAHRPMSAH